MHSAIILHGQTLIMQPLVICDVQSERYSVIVWDACSNIRTYSDMNYNTRLHRHYCYGS